MLHFREKVRTRTFVAVLSASLIAPGLVACGGSPDASTASSESGAESKSPTAAAYDGESVLRGIFFGRGPVAAKFPSMWGDGAPAGQAPSKVDPLELADKVDRYAATFCEQGCSDETRDGLKSAAERLRSGEKEPVTVADRFTQFTRTRGPGADATLNAVVASIAASDPSFLDRFGDDMQSGNPVRVDRALTEAGHRILDAGLAIDRQTRGGLGLGATTALYRGDKPPNDDDDGQTFVVTTAAVVAVVVAAAAVVIAVGVIVFADERPGNGLQHDLLVADITSQLQHT